MAVIITDMQMPTQCWQCVFHFRIDNESTGCSRKPTEKPVKDGDERPKYCPLKEAFSMLEEQEAEWVYGEDKTGVDGWRCSECNFFEPWYYDFGENIDFIKRYEHCPKCGRRMISYTGKQEGR